MSPRYVVKSITGYPINLRESGMARDARSGTSWWVADTACCHREVMLWEPFVERKRRRSHIDDGIRCVYIRPAQTGARYTQFQAVAEFTAAKLNAEYEEWQRAA